VAPFRTIASHQPIAEHTGLAEHPPQGDVTDRRELLAQDIGKLSLATISIPLRVAMPILRMSAYSA